MSNLDFSPNNSTPLYIQLKEYFIEKIKSGEWPEHYKLKSEEDFAKKLSVSRGTMRKCIKSLVEEGLLKQVHGKGTFVASTIIEQPLAQRLVSFSESMKEQNLPYKTVVIDKKLIKPSSRISTLLNLREEENVFYMKRIRHVNNEPVILLENYVSTTLCPGIENEDFEKKALFDVIENNYGLKIDCGKRSFEVAILNKEKSLMMKLPVRSAVLFLDQLVYIKNGMAIEYSNVWLRSDKFKITSILKR